MSRTQIGTYRTAVRLTNTAKEKMRGFGISERSFFVADKPFNVFIERYPSNSDGALSVALIFGGAETLRLTNSKLDGSIVVHGVFENYRLLVTNLTLRKAFHALGTNWQREESIAFDQSREPATVGLLNLINRMKPAKESSDYVKKRIASWEGYLKIQERGMDIPDVKTGYSHMAFSHDFSRITLTGCQLKDAEWKTLKNLSVRLTGIMGDVGTVIKAANRKIEVELQNHMIKQVRERGLALDKKEVVFSNFAALSQIRRLRQGFGNLEKGLAVNPQLDRILFEEKPPVKPLQAIGKLAFHNRLNEFQQKAVSGAMAAEDLYVIQGPPGTGKTTVISEICLQNARKGLRTLVASQSNLAVDNALGRLLANKDIRILRVGRTESIEEEGKKFIEENVGQYWKDHTLKEITTQYEQRKQREPKLEAELVATEQAYSELQPVVEQLSDAIEEKRVTQIKYQTIRARIAKAQHQAAAFKEQREKAVHENEQISEKLQELEALIRTVSELIDGDKDARWFAGEKQRITSEICQLEQAIEFQKLAVQVESKKRDVAAIVEKRQKVTTAIAGKEASRNAVEAIKKVDGLLQVMREQKVDETPSITYGLNKLETNREKMNEWTKLNEYNERIATAISYVEQLAAPLGLAVAEVKEQALLAPEAFTSAEIDSFMDKLRAALKTSQRTDPTVLKAALAGLHKRQNNIWRRGAKLKSAEEYVEDSKRAFQGLKKAVSDLLVKQQQEYLAVDQKWRERQEQEQQLLAPLEQRCLEIKPADNVPEDIDGAIRDHQAELVKLENERLAYEKAEERLEDHQAQLAQHMKEQEKNKGRIVEINREMKTFEEEIEANEQQAASLQEILSSNPEREYELAAKELASLSFTQESLKQEKKNLPMLQAIQKNWLDLLTQANDHDLDEIRKMYIKHANVIGTTCVASARKDFIENYPEFDVVIIDEVSKATPPELLLPMLKGKKIILVGDHHQLPPLLGNDTLEETLEEMINDNSGFEEKRELEKLLEESLFERLYKNLPDSNKTMLAIQYRMHEDIMETITPFYKFENDQLQCGIADSDAERDHGLESKTVARSNHLMWIDLPNEPASFEERMSGGKSLYNASELQEIRALLVELNDATAEAKQAGRLAADEQKSIGVISFYGEQVKRLQRMIDQELRLPHLTVRTGTVDRFQGSERDIIVLSMVRNNDNKHGDIGFAKDYRRLNVALSRAKELLVLVGSSDMFTKRATQADTRKMYQHVLEVVKKNNGLKALESSRR